MGNTGRRFLTVLIMCALIAAAFAVAEAQRAGATTRQRVVYLLPVTGAIDEGLAAYVQRTVRVASANDADALLIEINTFGGRVDSATEIRDALMAADFEVLAFVTERAWSAGALIALAADKIAMAPGSSIGAAEPRPAEEKTISALRSEFEATAERHGRDPRVAAAMVDARIEIEDLVEAGEILTLSAQKADEIGFVDLIASGRGDALARFGFGDAVIEETAPNWAERVARFLTDPTVSSLLLTLGFLGLLTEMTTPGWGVPGTGGLVALSLFFGARLITGLAGFEIVILFIAGVGLLLLEVLILPGFGIAGIAGIASVFASLYLSFPNMTTALGAIGFSVGLSVVAGIFILRRVPSTSIWHKISLETTLEDPGFKGEDADNPIVVVGAIGRALTPLRPAGTIEVAGRRIDAVSDGGFIPAGATTEVVRIYGTRVTVREYVD